MFLISVLSEEDECLFLIFLRITTSGIFFLGAQLANNVKDVANEKVEQAKEASAQLAEDASKKVDEVKDAANEKADQAKEAGAQLADDASQKAEEAKNTIVESAIHAKDVAVEKVQAIGNAVNAKFNSYLFFVEI